MTDCMIIRGAIPIDGKEMKFRPQSSWPDHHWTSLIIDQFAKLAHFHIRYVDEEFVVAITPKSKEENPELFEHLMKFAQDNGLDHTECLRKCEDCEGHQACLTEHKE